MKILNARDKVMLTKRDLEILQFTFEQRAVSCKQLAQRFFSNVSFQSAHARLEKLTTAKFLVKSYSLWRNTRTVVYGITEKGIKAFAENYYYQIAKYNYKSDSVNHDLGLVRVRERLEKAAMVKKYLSESMLQNCSDLSEVEEFREFSNANSDAALVIDTTRHQLQMAVEYEISSKQAARYITKLTDYYFSLNIDMVLYICGNASIEKLIRKADSEVRGEKGSKVFTCLEETFHKSEKHLPFISQENRILKLV
jgi:hypothetical protein